MYLSVATPIVVLLLAAAASYAITRPIGDLRRHIGALLVSLALGAVGGLIPAVFRGAEYETAIAISITCAIVGACIGMAIAWRRRDPFKQPQPQSKPGRERARRPHYGISRA
jgi:membrane associated rhomboid family serine protease